jgi:hypothetical protein
MTNYRLVICAIHDKPQFNYCFTCGAPLIETPLYIDVDRTVQLGWVCSKNVFHVQIEAIKHHGKEECQGLRVR